MRQSGLFIIFFQLLKDREDSDLRSFFVYIVIFLSTAFTLCCNFDLRTVYKMVQSYIDSIRACRVDSLTFFRFRSTVIAYIT